MSTGTVAVPEQRVFRIFLSYASEDLTIVTAIASCFKTALPDFFAEVNFDKDFLEPGRLSRRRSKQNSRTQTFSLSSIRAQRSAATDIQAGRSGTLIVSCEQILIAERKSRFTCMVRPLSQPANREFHLDFSEDQLQKLSLQEFESSLSVSPEEPLCKEIEAWQEEIAENIEKSGFSRPRRKLDQDPAKCVRNLEADDFSILKGHHRERSQTTEADHHPGERRRSGSVERNLTARSGTPAAG